MGGNFLFRFQYFSVCMRRASYTFHLMFCFPCLQSATVAGSDVSPDPFARSRKRKGMGIDSWPSEALLSYLSFFSKLGLSFGWGLNNGHMQT